jgi:tetratricopeptide (TPR) repeat protein
MIALWWWPAWAGAATPDAAHTVDLLRMFPGGPRIYVQAILPDGGPGLFLVDTGADISVLTEKTAERLGLEVEKDYATVWGLGGTSRMHRAVIPTVELGGAIVEDIEVAVGLPGVGDSIGFMPLAGILGNNVWSHFVLEIDYPADRLTLHAPGGNVGPRRVVPMSFDGNHIYTVGRLRSDAPEPIEEALVLQLDTGAGEVLLCGHAGASFADQASEGLEPLLGIGASEVLPPFRYFRTTRRVPLESLEMGGRKQKIAPMAAQWFGFAPEEADQCSFDVLIGHELLAGWRVWIDYQGGWFALERSRSKPRQLNGHAVLYEQDVAAFGPDAPERAMTRAKLLIGADRLEEARALLHAAVAAGTHTPEVAVLLAQIERSEGDLGGAWAALAGLPPGELVDQGEIVRSVNGLLLEGRSEEALDLAHRAVAERPDDGWSHVALADALLAAGRSAEASAALLAAADLADYPDAHLLRRARIALAGGDRFGAMADLRKLIQLYPSTGLYLWFYSLLVETPEEAATFAADLDEAMKRVQPWLRPLDFAVAGLQAIGDREAADAAMAEGLARDCEPMPEGAERDNCFAWYWALAGVNLDEAKALVEGALEEMGDRSDFLDTAAMVYLARGERVRAAETARRAARLAPEDIYMLWQAERIRALAMPGNDADADATSPAAEAAP